MFGCALPRRAGCSPVAKAFWAWLMSIASVDSSSDTSIRWPTPDRSAASTPTAPSSPVTTSVIATPSFVGWPPSPSEKPVIDISPADRLGDEVVARLRGVGSVGSVARDRKVHEARVQLAQRLLGQSQAIHSASPEVLDEHIRPTDQPAHHLAPLLAAQIQAQAALVPIDRQEVGRDPLSALFRRPDPGWPIAARCVSLWRLDLDHVRAQIGQHHGAVRACEHGRKLEHAQPGERAAWPAVVRRVLMSGHRRRS